MAVQCDDPLYHAGDHAGSVFTVNRTAEPAYKINEKIRLESPGIVWKSAGAFIVAEERVMQGDFQARQKIPTKLYE